MEAIEQFRKRGGGCGGEPIGAKMHSAMEIKIHGKARFTGGKINDASKGGRAAKKATLNSRVALLVIKNKALAIPCNTHLHRVSTRTKSSNAPR